MAVLQYDYSKLRGKIKEVFGTQESFAEAMCISKATISYKLNGLVEWTQEEMEKAIEILAIPLEEIHIYFFSKKLRNSQREGGDGNERNY